jgi:tetratricopeptide (TPR) repeat protein
MRIFLLGVLGLGLVFASPLLVEGRYMEAHQQGRTAGDAAGWLLAAQAANLQANYAAANPDEVIRWFALGQEAAQRSIELSPRSAEAHLELARAIAGQLIRKNLIQQALAANTLRRLLHQALQINPAFAEARAALALWHLAVHRTGVGWLYGADLGQVRPLFDEATRLEPTSVLIRVWYALALVELDAPAEARAQLEQALRLTPRSAAERIEQGFARERLRNLP